MDVLKKILTSFLLRVYRPCPPPQQNSCSRKACERGGEWTRGVVGLLVLGALGHDAQSVSTLLGAWASSLSLPRSQIPWQVTQYFVSQVLSPVGLLGGTASSLPHLCPGNLWMALSLFPPSALAMENSCLGEICLPSFSLKNHKLPNFSQGFKSLGEQQKAKMAFEERLIWLNALNIRRKNS